MKVNAKLLPNSSFGWFCFGICVTASLFKFGTQIPGFYLLTFSLVTLSLSIILVFPPLFPKTWESRLLTFAIASFVFVLFADTGQISLPRQPKPWFRLFLIDTCKQSPLSPLEQRIVIGLVTGSTKEIPKDFKEIAKESGILHLFAASGLHLGIFIGSLQFFGNLIFTQKRWISILLSLALGWYYLYLLNFPVSFVRAYCFAFFTLLSSILYRKIAVSDLLIISSAGIAFFLFSDFLSIGFLLSFGAVFGIFYLKPSLDQILLPNSQSLFKENFTLTFVCSLCSFPVLVYYFHSYSFGGIWINYCLVPLAGILLPCLYFTMFLQAFLPSGLEVLISSWIWTPTSYLLSLFLKLFQSLSAQGRGYQIWQEFTESFVIASLLLIFFLWFVYRYNLCQKTMIKWALSILVFSFFPLVYFYPQSRSLPVPFQKGKGYFSLTIQNQFFLYGNCSPYKRLDLPTTKDKINTILFESESCLQTVLRLKKKHNVQNTIWYDKSSSPFQSVLEKEGIQIQTSSRLGDSITSERSIFRFDGNPKEIQSLLRTLHETGRKNKKKNWKGILVLDFPPWKKKEAKEWITYQKLLGISNAWEIFIVEDHFEIPLLHNLTNPNFL
ncbi:ComEC/Rec2 family competence protein [Leptospira jelokensis]|uniref:ComEC/Rec2 family competence protein n=1 Tax=Leptospira jelokensis TaxID=2484931 RepID=A0A4Z1A1T6_9LEPT|nr:ComEC/Rec2 family competence protein [Leptospira jelokensis]TGL72161.1 ComEC/Rec2 family competence protein [Leptospira jelokensis]